MRSLLIVSRTIIKVIHRLLITGNRQTINPLKIGNPQHREHLTDKVPIIVQTPTTILQLINQVITHQDLPAPPPIKVTPLRVLQEVHLLVQGVRAALRVVQAVVEVEEVVAAVAGAAADNEGLIQQIFEEHFFIVNKGLL